MPDAGEKLYIRLREYLSAVIHIQIQYDIPVKIAVGSVYVEIPVSYTHLDVYKRQAVGILCSFAWQTGYRRSQRNVGDFSTSQIIKRFFGRAAIAVSYTHLDVYKRQPVNQTQRRSGSQAKAAEGRGIKPPVSHLICSPEMRRR